MLSFSVGVLARTEITGSEVARCVCQWGGGGDGEIMGGRNPEMMQLVFETRMGFSI